jgi:hypothetical protein
MKSVCAALITVSALAAVTAASPQNSAPAAATDMYHVLFVKAAPGQAAALAKTLVTPDKTNAMPDHFVVLRHQEGDDWDYVVVQHLGQKAEVVGTPSPQAVGARPLIAWHNDTFASGPGWGEFTKQMAGTGNSIYVVGVHRAVVGHRDQLLASLNAPSGAGTKIDSGNVLLQHVEGGDWNFLTLTRYNSWQDLGNDRAGLGSAAASTPGGWADIREHSAFHRDTVADRIFPAK